jgi:hypothetical protein
MLPKTHIQWPKTANKLIEQSANSMRKKIQEFQNQLGKVISNFGEDKDTDVFDFQEDSQNWYQTLDVNLKKLLKFVQMGEILKDADKPDEYVKTLEIKLELIMKQLETSLKKCCVEVNNIISMVYQHDERSKSVATENKGKIDIMEIEESNVSFAEIKSASEPFKKILAANRLPRFSPKNLSWPILADKTDEISFKVLKSGVILHGFTQLLITEFRGDTAQFKVTLSKEGGSTKMLEDEETIMKFRKENQKLAVSKEVDSNKILLNDEIMVITLKENQKLNRLFFKNPINLNKNAVYRIQLKASSKSSECKSEYGLNNDGVLSIDNTFEFIEANKMKKEIGSSACIFEHTDEKQGLFPSLLYSLSDIS